MLCCRCDVIYSSVWPSVWSSSPCFVADVTSLIQACDQVSDLVFHVLLQMSCHWSKRVTKCLIWFAVFCFRCHVIDPSLWSSVWSSSSCFVADVTSLIQVCDQVSDLVHHVLLQMSHYWFKRVTKCLIYFAVFCCRCHIIDPSMWPSVWSSSSCFVSDVTSLIQVCDQVSDLVHHVLLQMSCYWFKRVTKCLI